MGSFEVKCAVGERHFCIEVPIDCSVGDVLKKMSEQSEVKGAILWLSDIPLNLEHLFADYFEPEAIYHVKIGWSFPEGILLNSNEVKLRSLGVKLDAPQLLMEMEELKWSMDEFLEKAGSFAPTLMLIKMKKGTECGGVAGVAWPKPIGTAADPAKGSFIFSLGATPVRFDLVKPAWALFCDEEAFDFDRASDLFVRGDGTGCGSCGVGAYAGPRGRGQLVGGTAQCYRQPYERWELWRL
jgi:hypothetical protein